MFKYWLVVLVMCVNLFMYNSVHACVFGVKCGPGNPSRGDLR